MTSLAHLYVAAHLDELFRNAANERAARGRPKSPGRRARARSAWSFLMGPADRPLLLPTLTDYPYRG